MNRTKGFTLIELLVVVAIIALLIGLLLPALAKAQRNAKSAKDATQIAQIHKANIIWANDNEGRYCTPGLVNRDAVLASAGPNLAGRQIPGMGPENPILNISQNVYSALIAQQFFGTDIVIGPTEVNPQIREKTDYNFDAYNPSNDSYWDNTFTGVIHNPNAITNFSYAHMPLCGTRKAQQWRNTQASTVPVFGTRGTEKGVNTGDKYTKSPTLQLHGSMEEWNGNICFNDNHVVMLKSFYPATYEPVNVNPPRPVKDNIFDCEFFDTDCGAGTAGATLPEYAGDAWLGVTTGMIAPILNPLNPGVRCSRAVVRWDPLNP